MARPSLIRLFTFLLMSAIWLASASATTPCNQFFYQKQYAQALYVAPVVQYLAGQNIVDDAQAEKIARLVDKKLELRMQQWQQATQQITKPQTMLSQHCGKCHATATPKGGVTIDGVTPMLSIQIIESLRHIRDSTMPKDHQVSPEVKGQLMEELLGLAAEAADRPQRTQIPPPPAPEQDGGLR